jgi:hypothetical protein
MKLLMILLRNKMSLALCLLQLLIVNSIARGLAFDYRFIEDELKEGVANHVEFEQISDTPIVYRAWGVWSFAHPVSEVADVALNFDQYTRIFRYVYRCERITEPDRRVCKLGTWYVEGRAAIARVWAIGNIDTICWTDSSHLRFIAHQNQDPLLETRWYHKEKGMLNYRTYGVRLAAFIVASGHDSCRVGIIAQGWVRHKMPQWLISLGTGVVLPQLLQDLDKEVVRLEEARKAKGPHWYDSWYKKMQSIMSNIF